MPGHEHSPTVQPLGPTSPFLGAAKEMKDPRFSSLPHSKFCKGEFPAWPLLLRWLDEGEMRLRPDTLHYTSQRNTSTLSLFLQAAGVCSARGCVSTSTEGGN